MSKVCERHKAFLKVRTPIFTWPEQGIRGKRAFTHKHSKWRWNFVPNIPIGRDEAESENRLFRRYCLHPHRLGVGSCFLFASSAGTEERVKRRRRHGRGRESADLPSSILVAAQPIPCFTTPLRSLGFHNSRWYVKVQSVFPIAPAAQSAILHASVLQWNEFRTIHKVRRWNLWNYFATLIFESVIKFFSLKLKRIITMSSFNSI